MRVAFRVDSSSIMGTGHVMRCLTLAEELRKRGDEIVFVCRDLSGNISKLIGAAGFGLRRLPAPSSASTGRERDGLDRREDDGEWWFGVNWAEDAEQTAEALANGNSWDWLIVDHYGASRQWEEGVRSSARKIMVIDDLGNRPHHCDLLLDANPALTNGKIYAPLVPAQCRVLLGPTYALLRPGFRVMHQRGRDRNGEVARILVFFGGCDSDNYTARALKALSLLGVVQCEIDVIVGATNENVDDIRSLCEKLERCSLTVQTADMPKHMDRADLAIGGGGTTTWERCCVGLPALALAIAENQVGVLESAARKGAVYYVEKGDANEEALAAHLRVLLANRPLLAHISEMGKDLVDGRGAQRVANMLRMRQVTLRRATKNDCRAVYEWRNAPETREHAIDAREIAYERHLVWFDGAIENPSSVLLIGQDKGMAIASCAAPSSGLRRRKKKFDC
jgi:UDP-2,4-diacetamido-2,4,6-trideoxy-beta-L-altropyranose hydrolase